MKKRHLGLMLRHACLMVGRTIRSYALLSVTVVLSFSLLLGYMLYTDASLYNKYKTLFSYRRGDVVIWEMLGNEAKLSSFLEQASKIGQTSYYIAYDGNGYGLKASFALDVEGQEEPVNVEIRNWYLFYYPQNAWTTKILSFSGSSDIVWLDGRSGDEICLDTYEAVIQEGIYFALGFDQMENPEYTFYFENGLTLTLRIVGYIRDTVPLSFNLETGMEIDEYGPRIILSANLLEQENLWDIDYAVTGRYIVLYSDSPEEIVQLAKNMGYQSVSSAYQPQNNALEAIRYEKRNKAIISMALLVLLGINLYSSFTNALNDRKFEIGVKRAVGASSWSIVRQFLYESLIVMAANIFLSVVLVTDVFIVYKYIYEHTPNEWGYYLSWILYISPYSIAMFAICAVTLTVVFSLIFAYQSTQVEIVQYLKAE